MHLKVMTFNLCCASETPPNAWSVRRPVAIECVRLASPDVIGTQEGTYQQLKDISMDRTEYSWIGLGREGGSRGEFAAVFYKPERLEPIEFDYFWLSDTPDLVASKSWGNICVRMTTWVKFLDRLTKKYFYFWNVHFDHEVREAREKAAELILHKMKVLDAGLPIILAGDFNATAGANKTYDIFLNGGFADTWLAAEKRIGSETTFHKYQQNWAGPRIDWILTRGDITAHEAEVVIYEQNGQYPSDHFPVKATVTF